MLVYGFTVDAKDSNEFLWLRDAERLEITGIRYNSKDPEYDRELTYAEINRRFLDRSDFNIADAINGGTEDGARLSQMTVSNDGTIRLDFTFNNDDGDVKIRSADVPGFVCFTVTAYDSNGEPKDEYWISKLRESLTIVKYVQPKHLKDELKITLDFEKKKKTFMFNQ